MPLLRLLKPYIGDEAAYILKSGWPSVRLCLQRALMVAAGTVAVFWAGELLLSPLLWLRRLICPVRCRRRRVAATTTTGTTATPSAALRHTRARAGSTAASEASEVSHVTEIDDGQSAGATDGAKLKRA